MNKDGSFSQDQIKEISVFMSSLANLVKSDKYDTKSLLDRVQVISGTVKYDGDLEFRIQNNEERSCSDIYDTLHEENVVSLTGPALCGKGYILGRYVTVSDEEDAENIHCLICPNTLTAVDYYLSKLEIIPTSSEYNAHYKLEVYVLLALEILQQLYLKNKSKSRKAGKSLNVSSFFTRLYDRDSIRESIENEYKSIADSNYFHATYNYLNKQVFELYYNGILPTNKWIVQVEIQDDKFSRERYRIGEEINEILKDIKKYNNSQEVEEYSVKIFVTSPLSKSFIDQKVVDDDLVFINSLSQESVKNLVENATGKLEGEYGEFEGYSLEELVKDLYKYTNGYFVHVIQYIKNYLACCVILDMKPRQAVENINNNPLLWVVDVFKFLGFVIRDKVKLERKVKDIRKIKSFQELYSHFRNKKNVPL